MNKEMTKGLVIGMIVMLIIGANFLLLHNHNTRLKNQEQRIIALTNYLNQQIRQTQPRRLSPPVQIPKPEEKIEKKR